MASLWFATHVISGRSYYVICNTPQQAGAIVCTEADGLEGDAVKIVEIGGGGGQPPLLINQRDALDTDKVVTALWRPEDGVLEVEGV